MNYILRKILYVILVIAFLAVSVIILIWIYDGFPSALNFVFSGALSKFSVYLSFAGVVDYIISLVVAGVIIVAVELIVGMKLGKKKVAHIVSTSAGIVSFISMITMLVK